MIRIVLLLIGSIAAAGIAYFANETSYDAYKYASKETQSSLEVTEAQSAELLSSKVQSDKIAFAIVGSLLGLVGGLFSNPRSGLPGAIFGGIVGCLAGAGAGYLSATLGHWHDASIAYTNSSFTYWIVRWLLVLTPIAVAVAIGLLVSGRNPGRDASDGIAGSLLGAISAAILYCLLAGAVTPIEGHEMVFPAFPAGRVLMLACAVLVPVVPYLLLAKSAKFAKKLAPDSADAELDS